MPVSRRLRHALGVGLGLFCVGTATAQSAGSREISANGIDLRNGGARAKADWVRYKLVEVNGPTGGYILAPGHGDQAGYLGAINQLTGPEFLGALLADTGALSCAQIPTGGQVSATVQDQGEAVELTAWFGGGNRTIPAHFERAGETFDKHVVVADDDERVLEIQLSCAEDDPLVTGYFWQTAESSGERGKEIYFQRDESRGLSRVDVYYTHPPSGEHVAFRFETETGEVVRIWAVRSITSDGGDSSSGFAVAYRPATGVAQTSFLMGRLPSSDTTPFTGGALECLSLQTNATSAECDAGGLQITEPAPSALVGGRSYPLTIAGIAQMNVRQGLMALPVQEQTAGSNDAGAPSSEPDGGAP